MEIDEVLDWLKIRVDESCETYLYQQQIVLLLDYIDKLKKDYQCLRAMNMSLNDLVNSCQEEIRKLKEDNNGRK